MIKVYVRDIDGTSVNGALLGEFEPGMVDDVVRLFRAFTSFSDDNDVANYIDSRFVIDEESAHFEIMVGGPEA